MKLLNSVKNLTMSATLFAVFALSSVSTTLAATPRAYLHSYNLPGHGVAIEGYSPVSYFTAGKGIRGKQEFAVEYNGVTYYMISAAEQQQFRTNSEKYIPAYGGWCAFGMSVQDKFPIDPQNFKIVNGKLNLFLKNKNIDALTLWNKGNEKDLKAKAAAHWNKVSK